MVWSLEDEKLNKLFVSKNPEDVLKFYSYFNTTEHLIAWSRRRPHGRAKIYEVDGDKEIVVVIPTADYNGEYAKTCRENIFKGLQIVFVESGGRDDPYFNYARNCNFALRRALNYNPKWIILSNDDIYKIDEFSNLLMELSKLNNKNYDTVFINSTPDNHHFEAIHIIKYGFLDKIVLSKIKKNARVLENLRDKYRINYGITGLKTIKSLVRLLLFSQIVRFINVGDFSIFSSDFIRKNGPKIFDEIFINGYEDIYLSFLLNKSKRFLRVNFSLGSYVGSFLGLSKSRALRSVFNQAYFNYLFNLE